ncbi:2-polyprenyl-3-methyl-5-hydroxy-6-metoxy-1,4-benzoquinol methylase [Brevibacterium sanguinis]|uniref:2-polyprenyl-3-methyl-5-hydroxy-6-metoxy-1, 4-benzoquinol methylase n=2 Tax=Brevibacterium TaxID=1696 RepID=A0A366IKM2_9MICO|nr:MULTISPECIES: class I SAM-dependent methyltransferase [Brevibacterium]RBP64243.1 2-polyprenyl-3-methyl-5-hydroxy-6-metoxy-1,4-benzoquinol methylase [Brevibacterium sanguinis]RBP71465.1 2-polyprenyl-3-methyl-5-hydroxy-6-metoxy-1,4-benzoquinol methylase [Brevibacterium celere]
MILPDLSRRDTRARERMDDPDCDRARLERTYAQFRVVNALVAGWARTYRGLIRPLLSERGPTTLLDIGSGGGDLARALARWGRRDGYDLRITAADPDARAHDWARRAPAVAGVEYRQALSRDLVTAGETFDVVISNHLLHHLDPAALTALLEDSQRLTRLRCVHSDIHRSRLAYALFSVGTWPFFPGSFIRPDGLTSIRRSFTPAELAAAAPGWRVESGRPFRVLLIHDAARRR